MTQEPVLPAIYVDLDDVIACLSADQFVLDHRIHTGSFLRHEGFFMVENKFFHGKV